MKILLTSFATWQPDQSTNASDDLLALFAQQSHACSAHVQSSQFYYLRQIPVHFNLAPFLVLTQIQIWQPDLILCCGMAQKRQRLSLESQAWRGTARRGTPLDLNTLCQELPHTEVSHDAGKFVCNALYFAVLDYLQTQTKRRTCLFVHVPVLTPTNQTPILADFCTVVERLLAKPLVNITG